MQASLFTQTMRRYLMVFVVVVLFVGFLIVGPTRVERRLKELIAPSKAKPKQLYRRPNIDRAATEGSWVKSVGNPVLGGKQLGTCFDVSVIKEGSVYRMWFSWRPEKSIALVESRDGIHWSDPVIAIGPNYATGWEDDVNRPVVLHRGNSYQMWYTGQARGSSRIGYAFSEDGKTWTQLSPNPVLSPDMRWEKVAVMCPDVLYDDRTQLYRMWYSGGDQFEPNAIGYAVSRDGIHWTKESSNPIFTPNKTQLWESLRVTAPDVVRDHGWYYMFYIGFQNDYFAQIGIARSHDGITKWQRLPLPILRPGNQQNAWDYDAVYRPSVVFDGKRWLLWYNGRKGDVEQIGLATHEGRSLWP